MAIGDVIPHVVRSYQSKQSVTHKNTDMYLHFWIKTFYLIVVFISRKGEKCNILNFKCACIVAQFLGKWPSDFNAFESISLKFFICKIYIYVKYSDIGIQLFQLALSLWAP